MTPAPPARPEAQQVTRGVARQGEQLRGIVAGEGVDGHRPIIPQQQIGRIGDGNLRVNGPAVPGRRAGVGSLDPVLWHAR